MLDFIKKHYGNLICVTIYSLMLGTCSYQITKTLSRDNFHEALQYYSDKSCSKLSCEQPSSDCMEYCYNKDVLKQGK